MTPFEKAMVRGDVYVSDSIDSIADSIDMFLARKRVVHDKKNPTTVSINNSFYSNEGLGVKHNLGLSVALRLPNFEKSWALRFTTYDENTEERGVRRNTLRGSPRAENYGTSVALFRQLGSVKTTFRPRIELRDPLKVSHILRFDVSAEAKKFSIHPRLELFATPSKGTGVFNRLNFQYDLSKTYTLEQINETEYEDGRNLFTVDHGVSLGQVVTDDVSVSYSIVVISSNRPNYHMDAYVLVTSFRNALYKRVLEYSISPNLSFAKSRSFKGYAGANMNISLIF